MENLLPYLIPKNVSSLLQSKLHSPDVNHTSPGVNKIHMKLNEGPFSEELDVDTSDDNFRFTITLIVGALLIIAIFLLHSRRNRDRRLEKSVTPRYQTYRKLKEQVVFKGITEAARKENLRIVLEDSKWPLMPLTSRIFWAIFYIGMPLLFPAIFVERPDKPWISYSITVGFVLFMNEKGTPSICIQVADYINELTTAERKKFYDTMRHYLEVHRVRNCESLEEFLQSRNEYHYGLFLLQVLRWCSNHITEFASPFADVHVSYSLKNRCATISTDPFNMLAMKYKDSSYCFAGKF